MITYKREKFDNKNVLVYLDGKKTGIIKSENGGFRYYPLGQRIGGDWFSKISDCKKSLEC